MTQGKDYKSSILSEHLSYKLTFDYDVRLKTIQKTLFPISGFVWF